MDNPNENLEMLIDKEGLEDVVNDLVTICHCKAEHIRSNWPDSGDLAKSWERDAKMLEKIASKLEN